MFHVWLLSGGSKLWLKIIWWYCHDCHDWWACQLMDHILIVSVYFLKDAYETSLLLLGRYQAVQSGELLVPIGGILIRVILSLFICNIIILTYIIINHIIIVGANTIIIRITTMIIIIIIIFITTIMHTCISTTCGKWGCYAPYHHSKKKTKNDLWNIFTSG